MIDSCGKKLVLKNYSSLFTLYIVTFAVHCTVSFLFPVMPLYARELGASVSQVGLIIAISGYVTALLLIPIGLISDRAGRHKFVLLALSICAVAPLLYPLATDAQAVMVVIALHGLGRAFFFPVGLAMAADLAPVERRGEVMGWYSTSSHIGLMSGPIAGGFLLQNLGFAATFYICAVLPMLALILVLMQIRSFKQSQAAKQVVSSSWSWLKRRTAIASLLAYMFCAFGSSVISTYIPLYGKGFGVTEAGAGVILTTLYAGSALSRFPSGRLSDMFGRKPLIIIGLAVSGLTIAFISQFHSLSTLIPTAIFFGIAIGIVVPPSLAILADLSSTGARGLSMGVATCLYQVGLAVGATSMGFVAEMTSFEIMFIVCGVIVFFILLLITHLLRDR
jgi:MFS family permease